MSLLVRRIALERVVGAGNNPMKAARRLAVASGAIVSICTMLLIVDHAVGSWRDTRQAALVEGLEAQTKGDPEIATQLHQERKTQTSASVARETRGRALAWVLLVAGGGFVAAGKWWVSLQPERRPSLDELVAVRFGTGVGPTSGGGAREPASREARGEGRGYVAPEAKDQERLDALDARSGRDQPEALDLGFVDGLVTRFGRGKESAIPILQGIQAHYRYLPDEALRRVCETTEITPAQIAGTSSFYSQFRRSPVGRHVVRVCHGTACHVAGAEQISEELGRHLGIPPDADTDPARLFTLDRVACLGCCSLAPVLMIGDETAGRLTPATARQVLDSVASRK